MIIKQILAVLVVLGVVAAILTIGFVILFVVAGLAFAGWIYARITGKHPLEKFVYVRDTSFGDSNETSPEPEHIQVIEADYELLDEEKPDKRLP